VCTLSSWLRTARWDEKYMADGDVQNMMPRHYQIANNQKEKEFKMLQKKQTVSIANFSC
jgi:hypothetical protein